MKGLCLGAVCILASSAFAQGGPNVIDLGSRLELFVDEYLIDRMAGVTLLLHPPARREIVQTYTEPWEGSGCGYQQTFRDGDRIRMYYISQDLTDNAGTRMGRHPCYACYAESTDGIHWVKPKLGLFDYGGSKENNIVWAGPGVDNFTVYKDTNPACRTGEEYKAVGSGSGGLLAYKSSDGLHWSLLRPEPIITEGAFDTQNIVFWDAARGHYWAYIRAFHNGLRDIRVATSTDFLTWTRPQLLTYEDSPDEQLYTNQVEPYYRAPHLFVGFPTRYVERAWEQSFEALPDVAHRRARMKFSPRYGTAVTDGLFMTSRERACSAAGARRSSGPASSAATTGSTGTATRAMVSWRRKRKTRWPRPSCPRTRRITTGKSPSASAATPSAWTGSCHCTRRSRAERR